MMELLRTWMMGVTAAAILCALADRLMPDGPVRRVGRLTMGLVMLAAVLHPLIHLEGASAEVPETDWSAQTAVQIQSLEEERNQTMKAIIEQEFAAYIVDKAAQLGVECTAQVTCRPGESGLLFPQQIQVTGTFAPEQWEALTQALEEELGLPKEQQILQAEEGAP